MKKKITPTSKERVMRENDFIVSKTDAKGRLTYCNRIFIEFSGYKESELLGQQHNIDLPHEIIHKCMHMALAHIDEPWQTSPDIQNQIVDNFKAVEENNNEVTALLDGLIEEKQKFEGGTSEKESEIDLF